jgi:hypothetical protein
MAGNNVGGSSYKPSVVLLVGHFEEELIRDLKAGIARRLADSFGPSAQLISWGVFNPGDVQKGELAQLFEPFLDLRYWQDLKEKIGTERGPSMGHLAEVEVIILARSELTDPTRGEDHLTPLMEQLKKTMGGRIKYHPHLIMLGEKVPARNDLDRFWPRFWLRSTALGGVKVPASHLYEVCQTLILSLVCSDLILDLDQEVEKTGKKNVWIAIGSSAIFADLALMRNYVADQILMKFIRPLLDATMKLDQKQLVDEMIQSLAQDYYHGMLKDGVQILNDATVLSTGTWLTKLKNDHDIVSMAIHPKAHLKRLLEPIRSTPSDEAKKEISRHYQEIDKGLTNKLSGRASNSLKSFLSVMAFLLDKSTGSSAPVINRTDSDQKLISLTAEWPRGIRPVEYALKRLIMAMKQPDFTVQQKKAQRLYAHGEAFYNKLAEETEANAVGGFRQILRHKRSVNNIFGQMAYLIPAWPLLYGLLRRFSSLTTGQSAWLSLIPVIIPPVIITLVHYFQIQGELRKHRSNILAQVANFASAILAKILREYRKLFYGNLYSRSTSLTMLVKDIDDSFINIENRVNSIQLSTSGDDPDTPTLFELADFRLCDDWADRTVAVINSSQGGFSSLTSRVLKEHIFPFIEEGGKIISLVDVFKNIVSDTSKDVFEPGKMFVAELAEKQPDLSEGKLWDWLYGKAHPLGNPAMEQLAGTFTFMIINNSAILSGGYGEGTKYWPKDAKTSLSRLENEIQCFRGLIISL